MPDPCTVSGVLKDAAGDLLTSTRLTFLRSAPLQAVEAETLVAPVFGTAMAASTSVMTDGTTAAFSIDLMPGAYVLAYQGPGGIERVSLAVPVAETADLVDLVGQAGFASPLLQQFIDGLDAKAPLASPALTGVPTGPTAAPGTNNTQLATTAFVMQQATELGLGSIASQGADAVNITGGTISGITDLALSDGGTGASTASAARNNLGLGNVDNTADADKPVSTAQAAALAAKAPLSSPAFTDTPTGPTAAPGTNTDQLATTAFAMTAAKAEPLLYTKGQPVLSGGVQIGPLHAYDADRDKVTFRGQRRDMQVVEKGAVVAQLAADGVIENFGAITADGVGIVPVDDGAGAVDQLFAFAGGQAMRLTMSTVSLAAPQIIAGGLARANRVDTGAVALASYRRGVAPSVDATRELFLMMGDSTASGSTGSTGLGVAVNPNPVSDKVLMPVGGIRPDGHASPIAAINPSALASWVPAADDLIIGSGGTYYGSTGLLAFGFNMAEAMGYRRQKEILLAGSAHGGARYVNIEKDSQLYLNALDIVQAAFDEFGAVRVPAIVLSLGTNDGETDSVSAATFKANLIQFRADIQADIQAITGQTSGPKIIMPQMSKTLGSLDLLSGPGAAILDVGRTEADFLLSCPFYVGTFVDGSHMTSQAYSLALSYAARAFRLSQMGIPQSRIGLWPTAVERFGRIVNVTFNRPAMIATSGHVTDPGRAGVRASTGSVLGVRGLDDGRIEVTLGSDVPASGASLRFGVGSDMGGSVQGATQGQRTRIAAIPDALGLDACPSTGRALFDYCFASSIAL